MRSKKLEMALHKTKVIDVSEWVDMRHEQVRFYLTQIQLGHGCFRQYKHRFGHAESPRAPCVSTRRKPLNTCSSYINVSRAREAE